MSAGAAERPESFTGGLVVVSGPSGSGKTTIVDRLEQDPRVAVAVTATTRPPRPGERHGVDYHFLDRAEFQARLDRGDFVEHKEVFQNGHLYGSLKAPLEQALAARDRHYVLEIDVAGGLDLKGQGFRGTYVFIAPPSLAELRRRIERRGTETPEAMATRIAKAEWELAQKEQYDHIVVNDDLERALAEVREVLGLDDARGKNERAAPPAPRRR